MNKSNLIITLISVIFGYGVSLLTAIVLVKGDVVSHAETINTLGVCFSLVIYFHLVASFLKYKRVGGKEYVS